MSRLSLYADPKELEGELPEIIASLEFDNGLKIAQQMSQMTAEDKVLRGVISYTWRRWPRKLTVEQERLAPYWSMKDELSVQRSSRLAHSISRMGCRRAATLTHIRS